MADIDSLFAEFGGVVPPSKPQQVAIAAENKRQNLGIGYRAGAEADLGLTDNSQTIDELLNPMGVVDAAQQNQGRGRYGLDSSRQRSGGEAITDAPVDIINGILQGGLGIAGAATGIVSDQGGAAVSDFANDVNEFAAGLQSDDLNAERRALGARNEVTTARNEELYRQDIANGQSSLMAMLKREGRNFLDAMTNQDSATFGSGTFNGVGSLLLGGVMGKGLKALGIADRAAMPAAIGALEGGGAYQATVSEVMGMSHDTLMTSSPEYAEMIQSGVSPDQAKAAIANDAGLMAGLIQAPVGVATGAIVSKFEAAPFKVPSLKTAAGNIFKEGVEEGLQGGSGEFAGNVGISQSADQDRRLSEGVGAAAGEGALFGLGTAGAVQGPGVPVRAAVSTGQAVAGLGKKAWESARDALNARGERINAEAAEASPVSTSAVNAAVDGVRQEVASNPAMFDELELELASRSDDHDEQNAIADHVERVRAAFVLDPSEVETETNETMRTAVSESTDRFDAIRKASQIALDNEADPETRLAAGLYVFRAATQYDSLFQQVPEALRKDASDDQVLQKLNSFQDVAAAIRQDSELRQVVEIAAKYAGELEADQVSTPEQASQAAEAIDAFPDQAKPEVVERVLFHAEGIPEDRKARLEATAERLRVQQELVGTAKQLKLDPAKVTEEVMHTEHHRHKRPSAFQHMNLVLGALREGNREKAAVYLHEMMEFARHLNGKVAAYNQSFQSGTGTEDNRTQYEQLLPDRTWKMTTGKAGVYLNPERLNSVVNAKMVEANAKAVTQLANRLAAMLGDLGTKPIEFVSLDEGLQGNAPEVVTRHRRARTAAKTAAKAAATPVPAAAPDAAANPAAEPAQPARQPEPGEDAPAEATATAAPVSDVKSDPNESKIVEHSEPKVEQTKDQTTLRREYRRNNWDRLKDTAKGKFASIDAYPSDLQVAGEEGMRHFVYKSSDGKVTLTGKYTVDGTLIENLDIGDTNNPVDLGRAELNNLFQQMLAAHPGVNTIQAFRTTGARPEPQQIFFQLQANGKGKFSRTDPRVEQVEPKVEQVVAKTEETQSDKPAAEVEKVDQSAATTVVEAFPSLYSLPGKIKNWFHEAFKLPSTPRSRLSATTGAQAVYEALGSQAAFEEFIGEEQLVKLSDKTSAAYQAYYEAFNLIEQGIKDRLQAFLEGQPVKDGTAYEALRDGLDGDVSEQVNSWALTRALNLVEQQDDGSFAYNQQLLDGVVLAAMDWLIAAERQERRLDAEDVSKMTGVAEGRVGSDMVDFFNNGIWTTKAKRALATKIRSFWGVTKNGKAPLGYVDGIPEAMAVEALVGLEAAGLIKFNQERFAGKDYANLTSQLDAKLSDELNKLPDAISRLVEVEPEPIFFIGSAPDRVATHQMRNTLVETTAEQKKVLERAQAQPYFANEPMIGLYQALGANRLKQWFGGGRYDPKTTNKNYAKSLDGKNRTVDLALKSLGGMIGQARNQIGEEGQLGELPFHFKFGISKVGRLHMLGGSNPQSDKLVREIFLPTWETVDLTDPKMLDIFKLAIGQHLGIKVHKRPRAEIAAQVDALLANELKPVVELLGRLDGKLSDEDASLIESQLKLAEMDLTPGSLHALLDYARYQKTEDKTAFRTGLYIEADGITDGAINAMMHMASTGFSEKWVKVMQKGGLFIADGLIGMSFNQYSLLDDVDLYQEVSVDLMNILGTSEGGPLQEALMYVLSKFMSKDVLFDPMTSKLTIKRGLTKNPLTVTLYGSGETGIAEKIARALYDELYKALSAGPLEQDLSDALNGLLGTNTDFTKPVSVDFTIGETSHDRMLANLTKQLVGPMRAAIHGQIRDAMPAMENVRDAVQLQSIILQAAFQQYVQEALDAKEKTAAGTGWKRHDFLSQDELNEVYAKLRHLSPYVETGSQSFFISATTKTEIEKTLPNGKKSKHGGFGRGLLKHPIVGDMASPGEIVSPGLARVRGMPTIVIGTGDGQNIQNFWMDPAMPSNLSVFDGVNMGLNSIEAGSALLNKAVFDGWVRNPFADVSVSFTEFMENIDLSQLSQETREQLVRVLYPEVEFKDRKLVTVAEIQDGMEELAATMRERSLAIQARHNVLARVDGLTVDHMASAESPHVNSGSITIEGKDAASVASELDAHARTELARLKSEAEGIRSKPVSENLAPAIAKLGELRETGVRVATVAELQKAVRSFDIPAEHKTLLQDVLKGLALSSYTVTFGSLEQIAAERKAQGLKPLARTDDRQVNGFVIPHEKRAYIASGTSQTLVHELLHAATLDKVVAYYDDPASLYPAQRQAIARIEAMMHQWLKDPQMEAHDWQDAALLKATQTVKDEIEARLQLGEKAIALNEFMTYHLTNRDLIAKGKRTPLVAKLAKLTEDVIAALKTLLWGQAKGPAIGKDFHSNLRFNTQVLIYSAPTVQASLEGLIAFHATQNEDGKGDRLTQLRKSFAGMMGRWVRDSEDLAGLDAGEIIIKGTQAAEPLTSEFSTAFRMTLQEAQTFHTMVLAFMTKAEIDPNALTRMETLYRHTIGKLTVEDFMADRDANEANDRYQAQEKLNTLLGHHFTGRDVMNRSSLLPSFVALAMVNDQFRAILAQQELPKAARNEDGTFDAMLENFGSKLMNELDRSLSGEGKQPHVKAALDKLVDRIMTSAVAEQGKIESALEGGTSFVNQWNDKLAGMLSEAGHKAFEALDDAKQKAVHDWHKKVLNVAQALAATFNEEDSAAIQEGIVRSANVADKVRELSELAWEVVGRTDDNSLIFDMIKIVRTAIQQGRQQYREALPKFLASKFSRALTEAEWAAMFHGMAHTDLAGLYGRFSMTRLMGLLEQPQRIEKEIKRLQDQLRKSNPELADKWIDKANELSQWKMFHKTPDNLLRNAHAIAHLFGEMPNARRKKLVHPTAADIRAIDQLVSLYNLDNMRPEVQETLINLAQTEGEGLTFLMSYLIGQRNDELSKVDRSPMAEINHYKGHVVTENDGGSVLVVDNDDEFPRLRQLGFVRIRAYNGSPAVSYGRKRSYYFAPVSSKASYNQGIVQNVRMTASGVDPKTGLTQGLTAGVIDDPYTVSKIRKAIAQHGNSGPEALLPVYNIEGEVVAYEQQMHFQELDRLDINDQMHEVIGVWRGRQIEELRSQGYNNRLVQNLHSMWERDQLEGRQNEYVDLFDKEVLKDRVLKDSVKLFTPEFRDMVKGFFPDGKFMVRKDLVNNIVGYRNPSLGDAWTGVSRWSPETRQQAINIATAVLGKDAFTKLMKAERVYQTFITDARVTIVVKSVVVPAANILSNIVHLLSLGLSIPEIKRGFVEKAAEVDAFLKGRLERLRLEAEHRAAEADRNIAKANALKAQIQSILDNNRRLSIWPLIERGEFASISDAGVSHEEIELTEGRLSAYLEKLTSKLPPQLQTMARYGMVARDTALFKGLQRAVEYGDFLAKATLYDNLVKRKKLPQAKALGRITEEFIHYDYLPGRTRTGLDNFGLTWFWNYKLRAMKIALATIRNNPLNVLLAGLVPMPEMFGSIGTPVGDNMGVVIVDGRIGWSTGIDQALNAHLLNPWINGIT